jgi:ATP-dependent helicase HrpA
MQLNQLPAPRLEWLVPGLAKEKIVQLIKTLPQKIRARLVPVPEFAERFIAWAEQDEKRLQAGILPPLIEFILAESSLNARGWAVTPDAFRMDALPAHLFMNIRLIDEHERQLDMGRNLHELKARWGGQARASFSDLHETPSGYTNLADWTFGELPDLMEIPLGGQSVVGYPALCDDGDFVSIKVFDNPDEARRIHARGLRRLFMLQLKEQVKYLDKQLPDFSRMSMQYMALGTAEELKRQIIDLVFERACLGEPRPVDAEQFKARRDEARQRLGLIAQETCRLVAAIFAEWQALMKKLPPGKAHAAAADIEAQVKLLIHKTFIADTPFERLQHFPRYLKAAQLRIDKLKSDPARDERALRDYQPLWKEYERRAALLRKQGRADEALESFRWLMEELRVGLYAQELKTPVPVSIKRLQKMWAALVD